MKKLIFGALALAMITMASCRNENTEVTEETTKETAINAEITPEVSTEIEDSLEVEMVEEVDSLQATEQEMPTE
ncbi:hypothetical protein [Gramella sp. KN1008]|uniref:hypothetical protein n=1 Tax=Gramella sp. KN1008 TaxID=2529298 RepID=UPI00103958E9|nr:hypothetical protein [Gramella sp. KN1008]TBW27133.1 hypothetical protein EZJ28_12565 [Gramella sp. KN1008]